MRVARSPHKLRIPNELDPDLAYLTGYHLGDGYLDNIYKAFRRQGKEDYEINYADMDLEQLKMINSIISDKFDFRLRISKRPNVNLWIARSECKVLHWYLNTKLGIPTGKRQSVRISRWILDEKDFIVAFLGGFYDAEGDVGKSSNGARKEKRYYRLRIQLTQKDKTILVEIKDILKNFLTSPS